mgnify:FL=1
MGMKFPNTIYSILCDIFPDDTKQEVRKRVKRWSNEGDKKRIAFNSLQDAAKGHDGYKIKLWDVRQRVFQSNEGTINSHLELFAVTKGLHRRNVESFVSICDAYVRHAQDNHVPYDIANVDDESVTLCEYLDLIDYVDMGNTEVSVSVAGQSDG